MFFYVIFCYCSYTCIVQLNTGVYNLVIFSFTGSWSSGSSSVFSGVFRAEEVGVEDKRSGGGTMVNVQTLFEAFFEHAFAICLFH
jgi:hypothetical protein